MVSAIAPLAGRFRRRVFRDVVGSLTVGVAGAYYFWYFHPIPSMEKWRAYDAAVATESKAEVSLWLKEREIAAQSAAQSVEDVDESNE